MHSFRNYYIGFRYIKQTGRGLDIFYRLHGPQDCFIHDKPNNSQMMFRSDRFDVIKWKVLFL